MKTIQTGTIYASQIDGHWFGTGEVRAEREKGDSRVKLIFPKGPRTKQTVTLVVEDEELSRLAAWMRGEVR